MHLLCITNSPGSSACTSCCHSQNLFSCEQILFPFYKWDEEGSGAGHLILETFSSSYLPEASDFFIFKHTFLLLAQPFHNIDDISSARFLWNIPYGSDSKKSSPQSLLWAGAMFAGSSQSHCCLFFPQVPTKGWWPYGLIENLRCHQVWCRVNGKS